tara:strand:+ start:2261 stop:3484 length:1224 start_codon:yes stop_codon:yes gene_type:complete
MAVLGNIKKGLFPFMIAFSALSVSASAAFYSVYGLSKLFAGAQFEVIIMAGSLEVAKLVTASLLYQYWDTINKTLRTYLTTATVILVLITSMGIYGFLSAAYQDTFNQLTIVENEKKFLQQKVDFYQIDLNRYDKELQQILDNISTLSNAKSQSIQIKDTSVVGGVRNTISTSELRLAQSRIKVEEENRKDIQVKREIAVDSLRTYQRQILELDNNVEVAGELGPLKYISGLTGYPMDKIINILLLVIIFVFDPLAISLVVAANFAFNLAYPKKKYKENLYGETVEDKPKKHIEITEKEIHEELFSRNDNDTPLQYTEEDEKRMDIIGQNGNDGEHYDNLENDLNKDGVIDINDVNVAKKRIEELKKFLVPKYSKDPLKPQEKWTIKEIQRLEEFISKNDEGYVKTY